MPFGWNARTDAFSVTYEVIIGLIGTEVSYFGQQMQEGYGPEEENFHRFSEDGQRVGKYVPLLCSPSEQRVHSSPRRGILQGSPIWESSWGSP